MMRVSYSQVLRVFIPAVLLAGLAGPAMANPPAAVPAQPARIVFSPEQQLMLQASQKVLQHDYPAALALYDQVISANSANIEAYIQRSVVKREMQDSAGSQADAVMALNLCQTALAKTPNDAMLYYNRGTSYRLLKDFTKARADITHAMQLAGGQHDDWKTDLQAIDMEEKMVQ